MSSFSRSVIAKDVKDFKSNLKEKNVSEWIVSKKVVVLPSFYSRASIWKTEDICDF